MLKRTVCAVVGAFFMAGLFAGPVLAGTGNHVEFRPVLSVDELPESEHDIIDLDGEALRIWKLYYLSERDLEKVEIMRSATRANTLMARFIFNQEGRDRLYRFTKRFAKRRVAIFVDGKLVTAPVVWAPQFMGGRIVIRWPGTERELRLLASSINTKETLISLYIEEQGRYNDVAADAWAEVYGNMNKFVEARRRHSAADFVNAQAMSDE